MFLLPIISDICGWLYVLSWGLVAYPQIILNFRLKSVEGFKLDYPFLNASGFAFYSISVSIAFFGKDLPYNNYGLGNIRIQDLIFVYHSLCVNIVLNLQALFYKRGKNRISKLSIWFTMFAWASTGFLFYLTEIKQWIPISSGFNIVIYLGYLKIVVTLTKYAPLTYWNYVRKSTKGFSINSVLFDIGGSILSFTQEIIDYYDGHTPTLNPIKLGLGVICLFYDLILVFQHYVLYANRRIRNQNLLTKVLESDSTDIEVEDSTEPSQQQVLSLQEL